MTGVRFGECLGFTWDDIDKQAKTISVNKTWDYHSNTGFKPTKTKSSIRKIPLDQHTLFLLEKYKKITGKKMMKIAFSQKYLITESIRL